MITLGGCCLSYTFPILIIIILKILTHAELLRVEKYSFGYQLLSSSMTPCNDKRSKDPGIRTGLEIILRARG